PTAHLSHVAMGALSGHLRATVREAGALGSIQWLATGPNGFFPRVSMPGCADRREWRRAAPRDRIGQNGGRWPMKTPRASDLFETVEFSEWADLRGLQAE